MKGFFKHYLTALACMIACMGVYRLCVVPYVEPMRPAARTQYDDANSYNVDQWWADFFPGGAWQIDRVEKPTIIQNDRGVLLAKSWEQIGPKTWRLQPLTMILPATSSRLGNTDEDDDARAATMWIVNAEAGAVIDFEQPFDLKSGRVPSVQEGHLEGDITIERRALAASNEKPWSIHTSEVSIDRRRISTQHEVLIQWEDSRIRGRDLRIMLSNEVLGKNVDVDSESNPWGPLDELELYRLEELNIALSDGGLWEGTDPGMFPPGTPDLKKLPARLQAACGGRFTFNFKTSEATLTNGVHVRHQLLGMPADEFLSYKLSIKVDPNAKKPASDSSGSGSSGSGSSGSGSSGSGLRSGMQVRDLVALGVDDTPGVMEEKWVELKSPTLDATARGKRLRLEMDQQRMELAGKLDHPGATQSIAWLTYQGHQVQTPLLQYQAARLPSDQTQPPVADADAAQHAGWLLIDGPGGLVTAPTAEMASTEVRWDKWLRMRPGESPDEQWLELAGKAMIENATHGYLAADRVEAWLKRDPSGGSSAGAKQLGGYIPDRLLATGHPVLSTGTWTANVQSLLLKTIFVPEAPPEPDGVQLKDSAGNPMYQFVSPPPKTNELAAPTQQTAPGMLAGNQQTDAGAVPQQVMIRGLDLNAAIVVRGSETWVDALTIDGPVVIEPKPREAPQAGSVPWRIEGDLVTLNTNTLGHANLQIDGEPAKVAMADGYLLGPSIRLDQANNRIWMDHAGTMLMPLAAMQGRSSSDSMQWTQPPKCTWGGKMQFDGSVIRLAGDIRVDGILRRPDDFLALAGFCDYLDVFLASPVDLREMDGERSPADVAVDRVVMRDNVDLRLEQKDFFGNRQSTERMLLPTLSFHVPENKVVGGGTGWINAKFLSNNSGLGRLSGSTEAKADGSTAIQGAHLSFRDSMVAYLERREVVFDGKVELVSGPLSNWQDAIDPSRLMQLQRDQMLLNCDQLKAYDTSGLSSTPKFENAQSQAMFNFQATGNVNFEGHAESGRYRGNGYRLIFEQAKDQLILTGDGRTPARLDKMPSGLPSLDKSQLLGNGKQDNVKQDNGTFTAYVTTVTLNVKTLESSNTQLSQFYYSTAEPGQQSGTDSPNVPTTPPPNPRIGVSNFLQPNK